MRDGLRTRCTLRHCSHSLQGIAVIDTTTIDESFYASVKEHFRYHGMFWSWQQERSDGTPDTTAIRRCLDGIDSDEFSGPWASAKDRSPTRRFYLNRIVRVLFHMALVYSEEMVSVNRFAEAERVLGWLERFEKKTELGPVSTDEIRRLRSLTR